MWIFLYSIHIEEVPGAPHLEWMSLYEWDGNAYILNNERFYAKNNKSLIQLLGAYNYQALRHGSIIHQCETYRFYLGVDKVEDRIVIAITSVVYAILFQEHR